jgi:small-conductance mechanosensitive channel
MFKVNRATATIVFFVGLILSALCEFVTDSEILSGFFYVIFCVAFLAIIALDYEKRRGISERLSDPSVIGTIFYGCTVLLIGIVMVVNVRLLLGLPF